MGAMLGLEGIEAGPRLARAGRRPDADLVRRRRGRDQRRGAGQRYVSSTSAADWRACLRSAAPKSGAQFHFSLPGSVQGFAGRTAAPAPRSTSRTSRSRQGRALAAALRHSWASSRAAAADADIRPPDVTRMRTYELMATPLVYPGQTVSARVIADPRQCGATSQVALRLLVYGAGRRP